MSSPPLTLAVSWNKYLEDIFIVVREALNRLLTYTELPEVEEVPGNLKTLNRCLFDCINQVIGKDPKFCFHIPEYGGINARGKIPDFRWKMFDHAAGKKRVFDLECKRLGMRQDHSRQYVVNGVMRFILEEFRYGDDQDHGGMVGYVQGMSLADILSKVNEIMQNQRTTIPPLTLQKEKWQEDGVSELEHMITRSFPVSQMKLSHFWVDCRAIYASQRKPVSPSGPDDE